MEFETRKRGYGTFLGGCVIGFIGVCAVLGVMAGIWYVAFRPPPSTPVDVPPPPGAADVTVVVSEAYLTQHLQSTLPYTAEVTLDVRPSGRLVAHVVVPVELGPLQLAPGFIVYSQLQAQDGVLAAQVNDIEVIGVRLAVDKLPASWQQRIAETNNLLTTEGNERITANGLAVAALTTDDASLTLYLRRQ